MKVTLLTHTLDPLRTIATAGRVCYSGKDIDAIRFSMTDRERAERQLAIIHGSCFEHASFTFSVEGVSRDCTHQLVRHRLASFSQRSQRYVTETSKEVYTPQTIVDTDEAEFVYLKAIDEAYNTYERLMELGIPKEDARYVLPGATLSTIIVTMNVRELMHFFGLRCCTRAQKEIRDLAWEMLRQCRDVAPEIFEKCGPYCIQKGFCEEHKSCGKAPVLRDLVEFWEAGQ